MPRQVEQLFWIDIGYACFALVTVDSKVTLAPPIVAWMIGKTLSEIRPWLVKKKGTGVVVYSRPCVSLQPPEGPGERKAVHS